MWRIPRNVPASGKNTKQKDRADTTVRRIEITRTEITIDREVCSLEIHGTFSLSRGVPCPMCGHVLDDSPPPSAPRQLESTLTHDHESTGEPHD